MKVVKSYVRCASCTRQSFCKWWLGGKYCSQFIPKFRNFQEKKVR